MNRDNIKIQHTSLFKRQKKKFQKAERIIIDDAVRDVARNPKIGVEKKADLKGMWVHKFKIKTKQLLIAYHWNKKSRTFVAVAVHENFHRDVKKYLS